MKIKEVSEKTSGVRGFTLIELLVVIAIIGILAAMLLPVLASAKQKAYLGYCLNDEKQLALSWKMYTGDNEDRLMGFSTTRPEDWRLDPSAGSYVAPTIPPGTTTGTAAQVLDEAGYKQGQMFQFAPNAGIIHCPGDLRGKNAASFAYCSYSGVGGLNGATNKNYSLFKETQIKRPSERILWLEENDPRTITVSGFTFGEMRGPWEMNINDTTAASAAPPKNVPFWDSPASYHVTGSTFNFADGHAESRKWIDGNTLDYARSMNTGKFSTPPAANVDSQFVSERYAGVCNNWKNP